MVKIRTNSPGDVIASLPYQFGYQPSECVVLIGMLGKRLHLMMRLDTPPPRHAAAAAQTLRHALLSEPFDVVWLIAYEPTRGRAFGVGDSRPLVAAIRGLLDELDLPVGQEFVVREQSWFCRHPECSDPSCPTESSPAALADSSRAVAEFVALGVSPFASREELAARVVPRDDEPVLDAAVVRQVAATMLDDASRVRSARALGAPAGALRERYLTSLDWALSAWSTLLSGPVGEPIDERALPWLLGSLRDREFRDGLISWMCPGSLGEGVADPMIERAIARHLGPALDGDQERDESGGVDADSGATAQELADLSRLTDRLSALCRRCPPEESAPALTVAAAFWWWRGHGTEAAIALDRALELEPDHTLAGLLNRMVTYGLRPSKMKKVKRPWNDTDTGADGDADVDPAERGEQRRSA